MCCNKCGHLLEEGSVFCSNCGAKVEEPAELKNEESFIVSPEDVIVEDDLSTVEEALTESETETETETLPVQEDVEENEDLVSEHVDETNEEQNSSASINNSVCEQADESDKHKQKKINKQKKTGAWGHVFASFLSIFLAVFLVATFAVASVAVIFSSSNISDVIQEIDFGNIEIEDVVSKSQLEENGLKCDSDDLFDVIYDNIDQSKLADPLTKDEYRKIVESDEFNGFVGKILEERVDKIAAGKTVTLIEPDDVLDFLREEKKAIKKIIGYEITDERIDNLEKNLDENFSKAFESLEFKLGSSPVGIVLGITFSDWILPIFILIDVLLCVLIFVIVRSFRVGLNYCGVTILVISLIFVLGAAVLYLIVGELLNLPFLTAAITTTLLRMLIVYASVFAASIIMLIISAIIKKVQKV